MAVAVGPYACRHDVCGSLGILKDLSPESLSADLWKSRIGSRSHRTRDIAEHRCKLIVEPCTKEICLSKILVEYAFLKSAVRQRLDGYIRTCNSGIAGCIETVVQVSAFIEQKVMSLEVDIVGTSATKTVIRRRKRP